VHPVGATSAHSYPPHSTSPPPPPLASAAPAAPQRTTADVLADARAALDREAKERVASGGTIATGPAMFTGTASSGPIAPL
jgi:hypothetical protein